MEWYVTCTRWEGGDHATWGPVRVPVLCSNTWHNQYIMCTCVSMGNVLWTCTAHATRFEKKIHVLLENDVSALISDQWGTVKTYSHRVKAKHFLDFFHYFSDFFVFTFASIFAASKWDLTDVCFSPSIQQCAFNQCEKGLIIAKLIFQQTHSLIHAIHCVMIFLLFTSDLKNTTHCSPVLTWTETTCQPNELL